MARDSIFEKIMFLVAFSCAIAGKPAHGQTTHPYDGVTLTEQVRHDPPLRVYWAQIDLTNPHIHLRVCRGSEPAAGAAPWETTLLQSTRIAEREGLDLAVNGSYFMPRDTHDILGVKVPYFEGNPARAAGWTICDGKLLSEKPIAPEMATLVVEKSGKAFIRRLVASPAGAEQAVSGIAIVRAGSNVAPKEDAGTRDEREAKDNRAPHTAAGLDIAGHTLTLFVVDGRRPDYSVGMTLKELADEMIALKCDAAISLDGGGSSTMVLRDHHYWRLINAPSDGHTLAIPLSIERPVADVLGVVESKN